MFEFTCSLSAISQLTCVNCKLTRLKCAFSLSEAQAETVKLRGYRQPAQWKKTLLVLHWRARISWSEQTLDMCRQILGLAVMHSSRSSNGVSAHIYSLFTPRNPRSPMKNEQGFLSASRLPVSSEFHCLCLYSRYSKGSFQFQSFHSSHMSAVK